MTSAMSPREIIHRTPEEHAAAGAEALAKVPHEAHAVWEPTADRTPVWILEDQATTRVPELLPIRYGRMLASAFAFYRGGLRSWRPISPVFRGPAAARSARPHLRSSRRAFAEAYADQNERDYEASGGDRGRTPRGRSVGSGAR